MRAGELLTIGLMGALAGCNGAAPKGGEGDKTTEFSALPSEVALERIATTKADILFVIDNSGSMREEQAALGAQFPRLLRALSSGDVDGDGEGEFAPLESLRIGVVSTDMGLVGIEGIPNCVGAGDDGLLQHVPVDPGATGCDSSYPEFLSYERSSDDLQQLESDIACVASLGTDGCGFEQQLEAMLKATWPASDDRIEFLGYPDGVGTQGHGDTENAGLFETDAEDPSLLMVVLVTDEEDCSSADLEHFTPPQYLDPTDPLAMQDLNLRCFLNKQNLHDVQRYVDGLRMLRPDHPERVLFGVLAGVPPDLVDAEARADVDLDDAESRNAYYDGILDDARMQEVIDATRTPEQGGNLTPSCSSDLDQDGVDESRAFPPRRLVEVARRFGPNGFVQSICQGDFAPAVDALMDRMAERMAEP
jgi:hypothetical protein